MYCFETVNMVTSSYVQCTRMLKYIYRNSDFYFGRVVPLFRLRNAPKLTILRNYSNKQESQKNNPMKNEELQHFMTDGRTDNTKTMYMYRETELLLS